MKKIIRYLVIGVAAAIVFLVAAVAIFVAVFDANAYKQDLAELVHEATGRDLQFHGDVSLTVFPALGMKLGAMSFSNAAGFGSQPMIKVGLASISVDMGSLIAMSPEVDQLVLRDLEIDLQKNAAGVTNWDDLIAKPEAAAVTEAAPEAGSEAASSLDIKGAFGGLDLQNIRLSWKDQQAGTEFLIKDLDLTTGRIAPNKAFPMTLHLDASANGELDITVDFKSNVEYLIEQQQLSFENMALALNQFEIGGRLQLRNFAKPVIKFDLESQQLDVDALLGTQPVSATTETSTTAAGGKTEDIQIALPMQTLRDLDLDGKLKIAQIKVQNLKMSDVDITLKANNGLLALKPLTLNSYGGQVKASVVVDVKSNTPKYGISESVQGIQVGDLLKDYSGNDTISGTLNAETNLTTRGEWLTELKKNSNGTMNLAFLDGAVDGFNIRHSIEVAKAKIRGKNPPSEAALKTDFSSLTISGVIRNGVFSSDDLDLQAPLLRAGGRGSADLNTETVDYLVNAKLVDTVEGQASESTDEIDGLEIPVKITGPFTSAKIDVQLDEMLKAKAGAAKAKLKADIAKQKEALKQQLEAEKKALVESKKRELEKLKEIEKAKLEQKKEEAKKKAKGDLLKKLLE